MYNDQNEKVLTVGNSWRQMRKAVNRLLKNY